MSNEVRGDAVVGDGVVAGGSGKDEVVYRGAYLPPDVEETIQRQCKNKKGSRDYATEYNKLVRDWLLTERGRKVFPDGIDGVIKPDPTEASTADKP